MISSTSSGKLFIAGEYAVVEAGYPAILVAVNQFIKVSLEPCQYRGSIKAFNNAPIAFDREEERIVLDYRDNNLAYVIKAIQVVENLALSLNKKLSFYNLTIDSELENDDGKKFGLGSSAAVTVSAIKVLCELYELDFNDLEIFKLAAIVHYYLKSNGSGGDIAASVFHGWIAYHSYDRNWLAKEAQSKTTLQLLHMEWPHLHIERLQAPRDLTLMVGWTQSPASTTKLVDNMQKNRLKHQATYTQFLAESKDCVHQLIQAFKDNDSENIFKLIAKNRELLLHMSKDLNITIETSKLKELCDIANTYEGAAKSSGAGGGDCGIALMHNDNDFKQLISAWNQADIEHLNIEVYTGEA